jgi:hypothetical protein
MEGNQNVNVSTFKMHSNGEIGEIEHLQELCSECAVHSNGSV